MKDIGIMSARGVWEPSVDKSIEILTQYRDLWVNPTSHLGFFSCIMKKMISIYTYVDP